MCPFGFRFTFLSLLVFQEDTAIEFSTAQWYLKKHYEYGNVLVIYRTLLMNSSSGYLDVCPLASVYETHQYFIGRRPMN